MTATWREAVARAAGRAAGPLGLAAAPTFALMALLTAADGGRPDRLCGTGHESAFTGMASMYVLMGCFHAGPWLRLLARRAGKPDAV